MAMTKEQKRAVGRIVEDMLNDESTAKYFWFDLEDGYQVEVELVVCKLRSSNGAERTLSEHRGVYVPKGMTIQ